MTWVQSRTGSASPPSSETHTNRVLGLSSFAHCARTVVFPYPAGALSSVSRCPRPCRSRSRKCCRGTSVSRGSGTRNLAATIRGVAAAGAGILAVDALIARGYAQPTLSRSPSDRSPPLASLLDCSMFAEGGSVLLIRLGRTELTPYGYASSLDRPAPVQPGFRRVHDRAAASARRLRYASARGTDELGIVQRPESAISRSVITRVIGAAGEDGGVDSLQNRPNERLRRETKKSRSRRRPQRETTDGGRDARCFSWLVAGECPFLLHLGGYRLLARSCCCP